MSNAKKLFNAKRAAFSDAQRQRSTLDETEHQSDQEVDGPAGPVLAREGLMLHPSLQAPARAPRVALPSRPGHV